MNEVKIPKRILSGLVDSISAGVVPRIGAPYIAIGRADEIAALLKMLENIAEGGSSTKFIIGKYGSGKSFLIQLIRGYALECGFVTADADLSPERRFSGTQGSGVATYRELIRNLATKGVPDGGAIWTMISRWLSTLQTELASGGLEPETEAFRSEMRARIYAVSSELQDYVGGFDFAAVINTCYEAYLNGDDEKKSACLRWLRGEYKTRTEARQYLKVGDIINDDNWYDYIKLIAVFAKKTGYKGLVIFIDECVNLYKITNRISRENNYEKILAMFNDTLEGRAEYLGIVMGGTPQFLEDTRRGLFSYEALRSRLCDGKYTAIPTDEGESARYKNLIGPVIRLRRLSDDELFALIARITKLHAQNYGWDAEVKVSVNDMAAFLQNALSRAGADTMITPREIIRDYMNVLNILYQNPETKFADIIVSDKQNHSEEKKASETTEQNNAETELDVLDF